MEKSTDWRQTVGPKQAAFTLSLRVLTCKMEMIVRPMT